MSPMTANSSAVPFTRASGVVWKTYGEARKKPAARKPASLLPPEMRRAANPSTAAVSTAAAADTSRAGSRPGPNHAIGIETR